MKNSKKLLIGFAIVAVAIVAVIALKYPPVESPDAQGSIGAVQKYRDEQIKPSDVVLGDEQSRKFEAALYGALLEQAGQLQSFSADLASVSRGLENRQQLDAFSKGLGSREDALAKSALLNVADLQAKTELASFQADLQSIARGFENRSNLGVRELESFAASLDSMQRNLEAKSNLESKNLVEAQARLDSMKKLDSHAASLESMKTDLGSVSAALESRDQIESRMMESRILQSRVDQLGARVLGAKILYGAKQELAAIEKSLGSKSDLGSHSAALDNMAADSLNLSTRLESRALGNMNARLESRNLEAKSLLGIRQMVGSASRGLENRKDLESRSLGSMQQELQSFEQSLNNREAELNQKFALGMKSELAAINNHLESRSNLGAKSELGSKSELGAKSELGSKSTLESRNTLGSFNQYLGSLSKSLESRGELASRESALGTQAQELQNRAADLESKSNF